MKVKVTETAKKLLNELNSNNKPLRVEIKGFG
jgi:hypothetical protein